jgi:ethanolamine utilization protein EutN
MGTVTLSRTLPEVPACAWLLLEALDDAALRGLSSRAPRAAATAESWVSFDSLGAGVGQIVAVSEGAEAAAPFHPRRVPLDSYCGAIIDTVEMSPPAG